MSIKKILSSKNIATMTPGKPYGFINNGSIVISDNIIEWVGPREKIPKNLRKFPEKNLERQLITPALIDCHTHLVYGGNRSNEFEQRINGTSYKEIAKNGGGILSTVYATRKLSEQELLHQSIPRLDALLNEGIGTIEIKSGYGLDLETEKKMLRVARHLTKERRIRVKTSFLGAHSIPPEFKGRPENYIEFVCEEVLPTLHSEKLVDAVDGFCEKIAFTPKQISRIFEKAISLGLPVKIHAEQLSNFGGASIAASYDALSADHLEFLDIEGIKAMKISGTVAVLLPGAFYTLRQKKLPPINELRKYGVPLAIASDCNPGSSPLTSLLLCMNMACTIFRLTPEEAFAGITRVAARALGIENEVGTIEVGKKAEFVVWDLEHPTELSYRIGYNPMKKRLFGGIE